MFVGETVGILVGILVGVVGIEVGSLDGEKVGIISTQTDAPR
jgi:hypothetical protein